MAENYEIMIDEVDSLIRDENICVTYKFLCRHFSLKTVTEGRKLLLKCAEREGGREFMKTYLIGGIKCNESDPDAPVVNEYCLVRSENLDDAKSKFSKLTTSNLYSLQMSKIEDWNSLYTADLTEDENCIINASRASHIKYSKAENSRQIESSQVVEDAVIPQIASSISDGSNVKPATSKLKTRAPEVKQKSVAANAAKGSLKNMFMAQAVKKSTADKSSVVSNDVKVKKEFNSIENLCGDKQNSVNKIANEDEKKKNEKGLTKDDKCAYKQEISTVPSDKTKSNVRKHKKLASKKDSEPNKKRRRIIAVSDSSSNESDDSNNSCDIMETEDIMEEELQKPKQTVCRSPSPNGVRKKRKLVEETVVDDNGYLVTKKKWEHVSDSDEVECEKEEVKPVISTAETKKKSPLSSKEVVAGKNKQAVLTSFFLRKS